MVRHLPPRMILGILCLFLCAPQARPLDNLSALLKRTRPALVTLVAYDEDGKVLRRGPGFRVSPAGHIIASRDILRGAFRVEAVAASGEIHAIRSLVAEDKAAGLVRVLLDPSGGEEAAAALLEIAARPLGVRERVAVIGDPSGLPASAFEGIVWRIHELPGLGSMLEIKATSRAGLVYSLVVDWDGKVAGLLVEVGQEPSYLALSADRMRALEAGQGRDLGEWNAEVSKEESLRADAAFQLALSLILAEDCEAALPRLQEASADRPEFAEAFYFSGYCLGKLGESGKKIEAYKQAIRLKPDYAEAHYSLGISYTLMREEELAHQELEVLEKLAPDLAERLRPLIDAVMPDEHNH